MRPRDFWTPGWEMMNGRDLRSMVSITSALPHWLKFFSFLCVILFGAIALLRWKRSHVNTWEALGLTLDWNAALELCVGALIGTLAIAGVFYAELMMGLLHVKSFDFAGHHLVTSASSYLVSAFVEELLSRGLLLSGLILVLRKRSIAVLVMAAIFGLLHAANPHATVLSVFSNALGGVVYALAYLGSNRLWLGTGMHFAWNFVQGPVLGFPVSGSIMPWGGLLSQGVTGPISLTGGAYGPEGGLIAIAFRFVALSLTILWCVWARSRQPLARDRASEHDLV